MMTFVAGFGAYRASDRLTTEGHMWPEEHAADDTAAPRSFEDRIGILGEDVGRKPDHDCDRVALARPDRGFELDIHLEPVGRETGLPQEVAHRAGRARADGDQQQFARGASGVAAAIVDLAVGDDLMPARSGQQALLFERSDFHHGKISGWGSTGVPRRIAQNMPRTRPAATPAPSSRPGME